MNVRNLIDLVSQVHHAYPTAPMSWPPLTSLLPEMSRGGIAVVGDSVDVFESERPGAPTDALVCYCGPVLWTLLDRLAAQRTLGGKSTVVIAIPVDEADARIALAEDLAARIHMRLESEGLIHHDSGE